MASWRLALQEVPSHLLSDQEKGQIATQIIINQKYIEEAVNDFISVTAPIGYDALAAALGNLIPKTYESHLRPCTNGSLGILLKNCISLRGALRNLCAPGESNHGVLAADLCEPIQKLQEDGGYAD
ncbi:hypothetical protein O6H91_01G091600 [Diphasiastrum complanatum]|uniref:Uncharacterized protein n=1 Tax=Diphasiastrum complanatum TaxID=34168 RepID=A0ACC2ETA5_DIPCM|nr:hypothetical protein O6H91_01G091600 [Diphasiastrum complanatum]